MDEMYIIPCVCNSEALVIYPLLPDWYEIEMAIWSYGDRYNLSIVDRLRWCWKIITTGKAYADQILLDREKALELADILIGQEAKWIILDAGKMSL